MRNRNNALVIALLSGAITFAGSCAEVAGQSSQRGYSSRGMNRPGAPRSALPARATRPMNNQPVLRNSPMVNPGGPLSIDYGPLLNQPAVILFDSSTLNSAGDAAAAGEAGAPVGALPAGTRPSIRPRLNLADRDALDSLGILKKIRTAVDEQIAQCAEKPFTPQWDTAHGSVASRPVQGGDRWSGSSWSDVHTLLGVDPAPQHYDFRPDERGLIFVYHNGVRRERAVDARRPAEHLASAAPSAESEPPGLPLGVFAAVPPVDKPVPALLQLAVGQSGTISGQQYDFATNSMQPLHGALDPATQRAAWQVAGAVMEAGIQNLTEDVARALLFRDDGWTQAWILLRISASPAAEPTADKQ